MDTSDFASTTKKTDEARKPASNNIQFPDLTLSDLFGRYGGEMLLAQTKKVGMSALNIRIPKSELEALCALAGKTGYTLTLLTRLALRILDDIVK